MPKIIENIRETIINEGRKTLIDHNYKDLNIREIARNCGIGTGTFYNYFSSKRKLVVEVFTDDWLKTISLVEQIKFSDKTLYEKLFIIYTSMESFLERYISVFYEMASDEGPHNSEHSNYQEIYPKIQELLEYEKEKGNINSNLSMKKLSELIVSNFMYMSKTKYLTFEEFYHSLVL